MEEIRFEDVRFSYDDVTDTLRGIDLTIPRGSYVVVLGHNGSGKSTLAKHINALLVPDEGSVTVRGLDTADPDETITIRRHTGMVFQNPDNQMVTSIVRDDIAFGPENLGLPREEIVERVERVVEMIALQKFANSDPSELSGGQKQRVAIAGVLAMEPDTIIFDEPGAMLDPRGRRGIRRVMQELNAAGMTIIHITHFMDEALAADTVVVLEGGQIAFHGTPEEVFMRGDELRELGLEIPFSMRLTAALRERGIPVDDTVHDEEVIDQLCR